MLFLYFIENIKNRTTDFILAFGRVPFFFYFLHVLVIHAAAFLLLVIIGADWRIMVMNIETLISGKIANYGYPLWVTYVVWVGVVLLLYPMCKWYMHYKANNRDKWWLSYL